MWPFGPSRKTQFIQDISAVRPYTPDKALLAHQQFQLLFVCDDMMLAHKNYERIRSNSAKVSRGFTRFPFDYRIGRHTGKGLPFQDSDGIRIKGELHAVETEHVIDVLDKTYRNSIEFARCRVDILTVDREHQLMSIGNEEFLKRLPPGMIRTVPELGLRHYISNQHVCVIRAHMYIALKKFWVDQPNGGFSYPKAPVITPKDPVLWLPHYHKYPIDRNR